MAGEAEMPQLYLACGTEDGFLNSTRALRDQLLGDGMNVTYEEQPGGHEWDFWDKHIGMIIKQWLPLDAAKGGLDSGNVKGEDPK